jgi:hypothetical protein
MKRKPRTPKMAASVPAPLVDFSLSAIADDHLLTQLEVAALRRRSISAVEKGRYDNSDGLQWRYVDGAPFCVAGSLKKKLEGDTVRKTSVRERVEAAAAR